MVSLVSLSLLKSALRIDTTDDDDLLTDVYIPGASAAIVKHLDSRIEDILDLDSGGDLVSGAEVPAVVQVATIFLIAEWYDQDEPTKAFEGDELPARVKAILKPLRDPALA